ncbi:MAG: zinc-ribbon domain-containing protein [Paracoccaceae bacterium]
MRLVCPNCDAEYEVDDAAIPQNGRDVQCSNCGHAWFQTHPEVEAEQEAEEALYDAPVAIAAPEPFVAEPAADMPLGEEDEPDLAPTAIPAAAAPVHEGALTPEQAVAAMISGTTKTGSGIPTPVPIAPSRGLDASLLAVLKEEAEREANARKSDSPSIETQVEMGLGQVPAAPSGGLAAAAMRRIARLKGGADPEPTVAPIARSRSEMLPAIDEINSTLRATSDRRSEADNVTLEDENGGRKGRSGFGRGFMLLVLIALIIVGLYLAAPMIGDRFPELKAPMQSYRDTVDASRLWVDTEIKALITTLRGYEGGQGG